MGDGSAVQSVMLLRSGAAGNGNYAPQGPQALDGGDVLANSSLQQLEKRLSAGAMGTGSRNWMHNGLNPSLSNSSAAADPLDSHQHQLSGVHFPGQGSEQQQFGFPHGLQQASPMQAYVNAQMAQLHGSFDQQDAAQQRQQAVQLAQAAKAAAAVGTAQRQRVSNDGSWIVADTCNQQLQQQLAQLPQQQQVAVSALRQGLLLQQQQQANYQQPVGWDQDAQQQALKQRLFGKQLEHAGKAGSHQMHAVAGNVAAAGYSIQAAAAHSAQQHSNSTISTQAAAAAAPAANGGGSLPATKSNSASSSRAKPSASGPPSSNLAIRMTVQLVATYQRCTPRGQQGASVPQPLPRRVLTKPAAAVKNDGWDNEHSDLVLCTQVSTRGSCGGWSASNAL